MPHGHMEKIERKLKQMLLELRNIKDRNVKQSRQYAKVLGKYSII